MSDDAPLPAGATAARLPRGGRGVLGPVLTILATVLVVLVALAQLWTRVLWFDSVGYAQVLTRELSTQAGLFVAAALLTGGLVASSMLIGHRTRPVFVPDSPGSPALTSVALEPLRRLVLVVVPLLLGALAGVAAAAQWRTFLLWWHRRPFGRTDAQFGKDVGFFVFELPWWQFVTDVALLSFALASFVAAATHHVYGGLRVGPGARSTRAAVVHLSVLLAALSLLQGLRYWLDRYALAVTDAGRITGITYTGEHALLPGKAILAGAAVVCALLFLAAIRAGSWRLPVIGVSILAVCALVVGSIYPTLVQGLRVGPSQQSLESPYIARAITATRQAYGLEQVVRVAPGSPAAAGPLDALAGTRVVDPAVASAFVEAVQAKRKYYSFASPLDVDRYRVDGATHEAVVGVRELVLDKLGDRRSWVNDHLVYTHGYGMVAAYADRRAEDGSPWFFTRDLPPTGALTPFEPRIYFGERSPEYSVVGGAGTSRELDYPDGSADGQTTTTYRGGGGVDISSTARRLAYAVAWREPNLLLSDQVSQGSRILDHRTPTERVARVAPWLTLDSDPYPTVVGGRVLWVVDGYTTSASYPGSQLTDLAAAREDTPSSTVLAGRGRPVSYMRNAVKATVDAYDGAVRLYAWDDTDPMLKAWTAAFPGSVRPTSAIPGELMSHLRYPQDLFRVQRSVLARYHVSNPDTFFAESDLWQVGTDPSAVSTSGASSPATSGASAGRGGRQPVVATAPPAYLGVRMPGESASTYSLTSTFTASGRQYMSALLAADSDAGATTGVRRSGYGRLRLLELPSAAKVRAPAQIAADIRTSNARSPRFSTTLREFINLSNSGGSSVQMGDLLTLPYGAELLSVQPVYVKAGSGAAYPQAKAVAVALGDDIAWSDTLAGALEALAQTRAGADRPIPSPSPSPSPDSGASVGSGAPAGSVAAAVARAQQAMKDGDAALARQDFTAYGQAQARLKAALAEAGRLAASGAATPAPAAQRAAAATSSSTP